jgi:hypothetical protein
MPGPPAGRAALAALCLLAVAARATAQQRPLRTETAATAPAGTLELETGVEAIANEASYVSGQRRTFGEGPLVRLTYSPAASVELGLEWVARVWVTGEAGRGDLPASDWGDVTLRAKWRFAGGDESRTTLAGRFGVILPETSYEDEQFRPLGLGPNTLRTFADGLLTRRIGRATLHLNAGLYLFDEVLRPHDQRDFFAYGLALCRPAGRAVEVVLEWAGRTGHTSTGARQVSELRAGLRLGRGRVRADAAVRRGLVEFEGRWGATVGLSIRLRGPRPHG